MEIQYETYGIPHDCEKKKLMIHSVSDLYIVYQLYIGIMHTVGQLTLYVLYYLL